ncbi:MAG: 2'-5' RNA ligase family protein [Bacteroidetes bacterium]|nr:2'-5' RNA ligase family protein [Bacteroidota bacterium]
MVEDRLRTPLAGWRPSRSLYMFAIVPPQPFYDEVRALQKEIAERYDTHEALRRPVHITLIPPFESEHEEEHQLIKFTTEFAATRSHFTIDIHGFGQFRERVIYVRPIESEPLMHMRDALKDAFRLHFPLLTPRQSHDEFHPHITIGYRDLTHAGFQHAWPEYEKRPFERQFSVESIVLLRHDGRWVEVTSARLASSE